MHSKTTKRKRLSKGQKKVLDYIVAHRKRYGFSPTQREIAAHLGASSTNTAAGHIKALARKRYIRHTKGRTGGYVPLATPRGEELPDE